MKNIIIAFLAVAMIVTMSQVSLAGEYLGLRLGQDTLEVVEGRLKERGGRFNSNLGYKGYGDLRMIQVNRYENFDRIGRVRNAILHFTPEQVLYKIRVEYADAGETFQRVKDALDSNYGRPRQSGFGFTSEFEYKDGQVDIKLIRNTFGFGESQSTSLVYTYRPALPEVEMMKAKIEDSIRRKNAEQIGGDL